jgi:hypothetical protein
MIYFFSHRIKSFGYTSQAKISALLENFEVKFKEL